MSIRIIKTLKRVFLETQFLKTPRNITRTIFISFFRILYYGFQIVFFSETCRSLSIKFTQRVIKNNMLYQTPHVGEGGAVQ